MMELDSRDRVTAAVRWLPDRSRGADVPDPAHWARPNRWPHCAAGRVDAACCGNLDLLHPTRVGVEHFEFERSRALAPVRRAPERGRPAVTRYPPSVSTSLTASPTSKPVPTTVDHFLKLGARIGEKEPSDCRTMLGDAVFVVLILDVADDFLHDVLDRDDAVGAAIFVDHEREMDARGLHLGEEVDGGHRRRHKQDRPHDAWRPPSGIDRSIAPRSRPATSGFLRLVFVFDVAARRHERDQVADMDHADRIIERVVIDDEARMRRASRTPSRVRRARCPAERR